VAKFLETDAVAAAVNGAHMMKGVALVGKAVGTRVGSVVGSLEGRGEGSEVGLVDGGDITLPIICSLPEQDAVPKQPCLTVNV